MTTVIVKMKVQSYDGWKTHFETGAPLRKQYGVEIQSVSRDASDPNHLIVISKVESTAKARSFLADPALREAMAKSGQIGAPEVHVLEEAKS